MVKNVLVVETSPRRKDNSNALAQAFAEGAQQAGNHVESRRCQARTSGFAWAAGAA